MDDAPEPRHPTLARAASTGPPVPTGAATAVVAVHGLGGGLDRARCRGTLALQNISIVLQSYQLQAFPSINTYTMAYDMYLIMRIRFRGSDFGLVAKINIINRAKSKQASCAEMVLESLFFLLV